MPDGVEGSGIADLTGQVERMAAAGHALHVFALRRQPGARELRGVTIHDAGGRPRRARMLDAIRREHERAPFDVLHAIGARPCGVVAGVARGITGAPVILHLLEADLAGPRPGVRARAWLRFATRSANRIIEGRLPGEDADTAARRLLEVSAEVASG